MTQLNDHSSRDHALLSASSAARWLACPPSAVAAEAYPNEGTEFTREGTLAHEVAELAARMVHTKIIALKTADSSQQKKTTETKLLRCMLNIKGLDGVFRNCAKK